MSRPTLRTPAPSPDQSAWAQVPPPAVASSSPGAASVVILAAWIALIGPVVRASSLPAGRPSGVVAVGTVALALVMLVPARLWPVRLAVAVIAGGALIPNQGELVGVWLTAGLALAPWVALGRPPLPRLPAHTAGVGAPVAVLCGVAAWSGRADTSTWQPLVPMAMACAVPLVLHLTGGGLARLTQRVGDAASGAVSAVSFSLLSLLVVGVGWLVQRAVGSDPLAGPVGWSDRDRVPTQASKPWAPDPATSPVPAGRRSRATFAAVAILGAMALAWRTTDGFQLRPTRAQPTASAEALQGAEYSHRTLADTPAAHRGDRWYPDYVDDISWVLNENAALRPMEIYRLLDVETSTVKVHDRYRDTWSPPPCDCRPLRVWLYGGSGAFGFEQRDEHTIASMLSSLAADEELNVEVSNRGMPGQAHWRGALRLALDLTTDPPPDIVVFYDGAEEVEASESLDRRGATDTLAPYEAFVEDLFDDVSAAPGTAPLDKRNAIPSDIPEGITYLGWPQTDGTWSSPTSHLTGPEIGELAAVRYERSRALSGDTAEAAGVPVHYFWQPTRHTRPKAEADSATTVERDRVRRQEFAAASAGLRPDVVDLTDVFAGIDEPLFVDDVHINEHGASLVAAAMLDELRPELRRLAAQRGGTS